MKIQQFLEHHGIAANPFADEDAQTDLVFKGGLHPQHLSSHVGQDLRRPVGACHGRGVRRKGSGKTAIRLQIVRHLADYNAEHPEHQVFVVEYDDFNAFLDRFRDRFSGRRRRADRMLDQWRLWDHIDAILSLAVTQLVDRILENGRPGIRPPATRPCRSISSTPRRSAT